MSIRWIARNSRRPCRLFIRASSIADIELFAHAATFFHYLPVFFHSTLILFRDKCHSNGCRSLHLSLFSTCLSFVLFHLHRTTAEVYVNKIAALVIAACNLSAKNNHSMSRAAIKDATESEPNYLAVGPRGRKDRASVRRTGSVDSILRRPRPKFGCFEITLGKVKAGDDDEMVAEAYSPKYSSLRH